MRHVTEAEAQIREELLRIQPRIEEITGLHSRWNGTVELVPDPGFRGKKRFSCLIVMDAELVEDDLRWRTSIHELLHAVSAGYVQSDYLALRGWEEGVVEALQRLIRPSLLAGIGVAVPEEAFRGAEENHPFNHYLAALETLREKLDRPAMGFYLNLLRTPIRGRPASVFESRNNLPGGQRRDFVTLFARAHTTLKG
jgi:hypothetical protein